ncbi:MAG: hypothetical protein NTW96_24545 [Planctomycetia bacterium]|nr:hypothetical protein [Planctomycetia bacterium]
MEEAAVTLTWTPNGRAGNVTITVESDGGPLAVDTVCITKEEKRKAFLKSLMEKVPGLDESRMDAELLAIAATVNRGDVPAEQSEEIALGRVVRPELFHLAELSGVAIPATVKVFTDDGSQIRGRWFLYLRHHESGKRERIAFSDQLEIEGVESIWFHPRPSEPSPQTSPGWSAEGRREWLGGRPCPDPIDVFERLCKAVAYYIDFPGDDAPGHCAVLAIWSILTYVYPAWPAVPYLHFGGPAGSGKSRCFEVLDRIVFRPLGASSISSAALFRTLHDRGGVVLFDEAEQLRRSNDPGVGELLSMLLAGYKRGGRALRLEKVGDGFQTVAFEVYGPKGVACTAGLPPALSSRAITIPMFRAAADSPKPRRRLGDGGGRWQALRDDLHCVALEHGLAWQTLSRNVDACPSMSGRDFELWQPIMAIGQWLEDRGAAGLHGLLVEHAARSIDAAGDDAVPDADVVLLRALHAALRNFETPTAKELLVRAQESEPTVFAKWSAKAIGTHLGRYGVKTTKTHGRRVFRPELPEVERIAGVYGIDLDPD